jgi:D-arabinose 1-dehydrogenase-like Zn-dependent alcohol dehydrogenase
LGSPREPGDTVAVLGVGRLGHLGVQFAAKMGFRTVFDRGLAIRHVDRFRGRARLQPNSCATS